VNVSEGSASSLATSQLSFAVRSHHTTASSRRRRHPCAPAHHTVASPSVAVSLVPPVPSLRPHASPSLWRAITITIELHTQQCFASNSKRPVLRALCEAASDPERRSRATLPCWFPRLAARRHHRRAPRPSDVSPRSPRTPPSSSRPSFSPAAFAVTAAQAAFDVCAPSCFVKGLHAARCAARSHA
jgi:hypothetical protein